MKKINNKTFGEDRFLVRQPQIGDSCDDSPLIFTHRIRGKLGYMFKGKPWQPTDFSAGTCYGTRIKDR